MKASTTSGGIDEEREHFKAHTVKLAMVWAGAELGRWGEGEEGCSNEEVGGEMVIVGERRQGKRGNARYCM